MKNSTLAPHTGLLLLLALASNLTAFEQPKTKWAVPTQGHVTAAPAIAKKSGTVYVGTVGSVADSSSLWAITPAGVSKRISSFLGPIQSTPVLSENEATIYVTSNYKQGDLENATGMLDAITTRDGERASYFNHGDTVKIDKAIMGSLKLEPGTFGNIFVNTLEEPERTAGIAKWHPQQKLYVYNSDGARIFSEVINRQASIEWKNDFSRHEIALNKWGGTAQISYRGWLSGWDIGKRGYRLSSYWHAAGTGTPSQWSSWHSPDGNMDFANAFSDPAIDTHTQNIYVATQKGALDIYKNSDSPSKDQSALHTIVVDDTTDFSRSAPTIVEKDAPAVKTGTVLLGGANGHIYAINPGHDDVAPSVIFEWHLDLDTAPLDNRMVIDESNYILYATSIRDGFLYAIELNDKNYLNENVKVLWRAEHVTTTPALLPDGAVVVGSVDDNGNDEVKAYVGGRVNA